MDNSSTLVQPIETSCGWSTPNVYRDLLIREHAAEFSAATLLYETIDEQEITDKKNLLESCRSHAWFIRHEVSGDVRVASNSCKLRWCPLCAAARQNFITTEVGEWFHQVNYPKLLTLTLRHTSSPLKDQVDFLYKCWQKFRKRKFVSKRLRGGVWFFQVKKSEKDNTWHPHIHVLLDSDYMDRKVLSRLWAEITHGSVVIDIRGIIDTDKAVKHNARYCATPAQLQDLNLWEQVELFYCFQKRRLVGCFGSAKTISLRPSKPPDAESWINIGAWSTIIALAGEDSNADDIIKAWRFNKPLDKEISFNTLDKEIDGLPPPIEKPLTDPQLLLDFYV